MSLIDWKLHGQLLTHNLPISTNNATVGKKNYKNEINGILRSYTEKKGIRKHSDNWKDQR